jgi:hypothetical protein
MAMSEGEINAVAILLAGLLAAEAEGNNRRRSSHVPRAIPLNQWRTAL